MTYSIKKIKPAVHTYNFLEIAKKASYETNDFQNNFTQKIFTQKI